MDILKNNWKLILSILLILISILVLVMGYAPNKLQFQTEEMQLTSTKMQLETSIAEDQRYARVQALLEPSSEAIDASRTALYRRFPAELREEDQIMYVLYLEEKFGTEIMFDFGTVAPIVGFSDGAILNGLSLTVNYESSYADFKNMINYLAQDERVTSIQYATMTYDAENDLVSGNLTLLLYMVDSTLVDYYRPNITPSEQGKDNIFEGSVLTPEDVKEMVDGEGSADRPSSDDTTSEDDYPEWLLGPKEPNNSAEGVIPGYVDN